MKGRIFKSVAAAVLAFASHLAHAGTVTYVYTDPQGTPLAEANASGTITATFDYQPYGSQALGSPKAGPGYTGHVNDPDTGFVYMQARYYDPATGRFLSVDPVQPRSGWIFGFNRYVYGNNSPIIFLDPDGRLPKWMERLFPKGDLFRTAGDSIGAETAFVVGVATNNRALADAAVDGMREATSNGKGAYAVATLALSGRSGGVEVPTEITLSRQVHGEAAQHAADAIAGGKPDVLTIDRSGAPANRQASIGALNKVPGKHLDEYPPAMFKEGGAGASVRAINPRDNMSAGACIGNACRGLPDGARIRIKVEN